jgi:ABC-type transport system involved in multi-copper enzyme maturation permease subunit
MLGGMEISMVLFSVFMGISLFQKELSLGSISMTLSKPVFRSQFLLGKFFGQLVVQSLVIMGMGLTTVFCASRFGSDFSAIGIMQASLMVVLQVAVLTSVTYLFSVGTNGTLTAIATLGVYVIGHLKGSMATSASGKAPGALWAFVRSIFPDLEIFNIKTLVSYGYGVGIEQVGWCALYTLLCITIFLGIASFSFNRRDILT